jgi:hypothetical protein
MKTGMEKNTVRDTTSLNEKHLTLKVRETHTQTWIPFSWNMMLYLRVIGSCFEATDHHQLLGSKCQRKMHFDPIISKSQNVQEGPISPL